MVYDKAMPGSATDAWHHVHLAAPAFGEREHMKLMFEYAYMSADKPRDMSLWMAPGADGGADMYASPQSVSRIARLIACYDARPCTGPTRPVVLVAGYQYPARRMKAGVFDMPGVGPAARFDAPAPYACRCVKQLSRGAPVRRYAWWDMAPFVRRYVDAWLL